MRKEWDLQSYEYFPYSWKPLKFPTFLVKLKLYRVLWIHMKFANLSPEPCGTLHSMENISGLTSSLLINKGLLQKGSTIGLSNPQVSASPKVSLPRVQKLQTFFNNVGLLTCSSKCPICLVKCLVMDWCNLWALCLSWSRPWCPAPIVSGWLYASSWYS